MISTKPSICKIPLDKGLIAIIDQQDFEVVSQFNWHTQRGRYCWYAVTCCRSSRKGKRIHLRMHRLIYTSRGIDISNTQIDHKDRDGLNNQFSNLRIAKHSQNNINQQRRKDNSSGYKGVHLHVPKYGEPQWRARIQVNGKRLHLGCFESPSMAAQAYNEAAIKYFGEFAVLNEV